MGIIDAVYPDGQQVQKVNVRADDKAGHRRTMASVDNVRNNDLTGQFGGIYVRSIQQFYDIDTENLDADDGDGVVIDSAGNHFVKLDLGSGSGGVLPFATSDSIGLIGDGTTDNSTALQAWFDSLPDAGGKLVLSPGKFKISSTCTMTFSPSATGSSDDKKTIASVTIEGAGSDLSIFYCPTTSGLEFDCSSFQHTVHLRDFSMTTGTTNGGTAIKVTNTFPFFGSYTAQHDINGVTVRGDDGYGATQYFTKAVELFNATNINLDNNNFYGPVDAAAAGAYDFGIGIDITSSATPGGGTSTTPGFGTSYNISRTNLVFLGVGINLGEGCQALSFSNGSAILNGAVGINVPSGVTEVRQITISGAQIAVNDNAIVFGSGVSGCVISGNYIGVAPSKSGIVLSTDTGAPNGGGTTIVGNTFIPLDTGAANGVYVNTSFNPITIVGNTFLGLVTGVALDAGSSSVLVSNNKFSSCTSDVADSGTSNVVPESAWKSVSATLTPGSGSLTSGTATVKYKKIGKTVNFFANLQITTNGTAATNLQVTLPIAAVNVTPADVRENNITGFLGSGVVSSSTLYVTKYDGTYLGGNGYQISVGGAYEAA